MPTSDAPLSLIFAPVTPEQARLFGGIGRMLDRRGVSVRFVAPHESVIAALRGAWDGLIDVFATGVETATQDAAEPGESCATLGAYDAWRGGWSEDQRRHAARTAADAWTTMLAKHATDALIFWNGRDHVFVEAGGAAGHAAGITPLFCELGPLRRNPMTMAITRGGVNAQAEFRRPELLTEALAPLEAARLAAARHTLRAAVGAAECQSGESRYAFLPLQVDDDTQLFYYMPHFANQVELVRAVVAGLPDDLPLVLKLHPLADERRGRAVYEGLLRPQDRIAGARRDTLALLAGAELVVTNNSSAGIEALVLERPVAVLGKAHYGGRGFTLDYHGGKFSPSNLAPEAPDSAARRDRYLFELLFQELVHLDGHPLRAPLSDEEYERLAIRVLDLLRPLELGSDWSGVFAELGALRQQIGAALQEAVAAFGQDAVVLASRGAIEMLGGAAVGPLLPLEQTLEAPARLRGQDVLLLAPDFSPAQRLAARRGIASAGARRIGDALEGLARVPCHFHTARFNSLPSDMRATLYRQVDYWDYYLTQSGIRPENSPEKQTQVRTLAAAVSAAEPRSVLEYGCGDGRILAGLMSEARARSRPVVGVDSSARMLSLARTRLGCIEGLQLLPADARAGLPIQDRAFDLTVTCGALQHVHHSELGRVIAELHRVTRRTLLHWEACESLQPETGTHYTNPDTSRAIHRATCERYGPVRATVRDVRPLTGQPSLLGEYDITLPLITVLTLHAIESPPSGIHSYDYRNMFLAAGAFEALIDGLRRDGWAFLTLSEADACRRGAQPTPHKAIVLTFDDGYASVFDVALPVLAARGIRGAAFIPVDFIGGRFAGNVRGGAGPALATMSAQQILALRAAGWDIGAHSCSHPIFATLDDRAAERELKESRARLESLLAEPVKAFAFPYGEPEIAFTPRQVSLAQECGFETVLSTAPGFVAPLRAGTKTLNECGYWPRIGVDHDATSSSLLDDLYRTHRVMSGWPAAPAAGPSLGERVRQVVQHCVKRGVQRIALYGAGQHTARLLQSTPLWPLDVLAIVDDDATLAGQQRYGLPVLPPAQLARLRPDAVLISSDRYEDAIYARLTPLLAGGIDVLRLYAESA